MAVAMLPAHAAPWVTEAGGEATVMGYVSQGMGYGLRDTYDSAHGVNSLITTVLLEGVYKPNDDLKFYGSLMATGDWIYAARANSNSWTSRQFDQSREFLQFDDKYWQILRELHVTWTGKNSMLRIGKQVVKWGEMDGQQIIDTINPVDQRRGFADVAFETSVIPIWLIRAEYYPESKPSWLQDLGIEYVLNPNIDFIPSQEGALGNNRGSIWAPNVPGLGWKQINPPFCPPGPPCWVPGEAGLPPFMTGPVVQSRLGSPTSQNISKPSGSDGIQHALRIKANFGETLATVNYFYGRERKFVQRDVPGTTPQLETASDGTLIEHHYQEGYYPRKQFVGFTLTRDLTPLKSYALGGVSPIVRIESLYSFNSTFSVGRMSNGPNAPPVFTYDRMDTWDTGIGIDWGVRIPFLNSRSSFRISPQFFMQRLMGYPSDAIVVLTPGTAGVERNNYSTSLFISTSYFNDKLSPGVFWLHDVNNQANFYRAQLMYSPTALLSFTVGGMYFDGRERGKSFQLFDNKDQLFAKITYKFD